MLLQHFKNIHYLRRKLRWRHAHIKGKFLAEYIVVSVFHSCQGRTGGGTTVPLDFDEQIIHVNKIQGMHCQVRKTNLKLGTYLASQKRNFKYVYPKGYVKYTFLSKCLRIKEIQEYICVMNLKKFLKRVQRDKHSVSGPETDFDETYPKKFTIMRNTFGKNFGLPA